MITLIYFTVCFNLLIQVNNRHITRISQPNYSEGLVEDDKSDMYGNDDESSNEFGNNRDIIQISYDQKKYLKTFQNIALSRNAI